MSRRRGQAISPPATGPRAPAPDLALHAPPAADTMAPARLAGSPAADAATPMKRPRAIRIVDDAAGPRARPPAGSARLGVDLPVFDQTVRIVADVPDRPLRMSDAVPLAREVCDRVVAAAIRHGEAVGEPVSCSRGCSACCETPVLISAPEAFRLIADIASQAGDRGRRVKAALAAAEKRLAAPGPPAHACPLLAGHVCTIRAFRPCVCRAFLATSPPELCDTRERRVMPLSVDVPLALRRWAAELDDDASGPVLLSAVVSWSGENRARGRRTWPGPHMVRRLFDALSATAQESP